MAAIAEAPRHFPRAVVRPSARGVFGCGLTLVLVTIGLRGGGGVQLGSTTAVEIALLLGGGLLGAGAAIASDGRRAWGATTLALMALLAGLTATSVMWAVEPSDAWLEANRTCAYLAVLGAGIALAREAGAWWPALLGSVVAFAGIVSGFAVLTKIIPGALNPDETFARLREPYDYWNAVGLSAALGVPGCLWLGSRRSGHAAISALAYPVLALALLTILLAYSRGALLAAAVGAALWFAVVPLRLRGAAVLSTAALGTGLVAWWAFSQDALTTDRVALDARETAGVELGIAVAFMLAAMLAAGLAIGYVAARRAPRPEARRRAGAVLLVALALLPILFLGSLAVSDRGLGGSLSKGWRSLTDPDATTPSNDPSRLTAVGSVRARYWDQALNVYDEQPWIGAGAGGYPTARRRHRNDELVVRHAHGYGVQVAADLGTIGLAANLALFVAFLVAAGRATAMRRDWRREPFTPERIGLLTALAVVVTFGVHSFVDWTWFTPGTAVPALLCAGWLVGRGPPREAPGEPRTAGERLRAGLRRPSRIAVAAAIIALAGTAAWATWQPLRSVHAGDEAIDVLNPADPAGSTAKARELVAVARDRNPLSVQPLFELAVIEVVAGRKDEARRALEDAVHLQPRNPETWLRAAEFALRQDANARRTIELLGPALYLDPRSDQAAALYLEASRQGGVAGAPATATPIPIPPAGTVPGGTQPPLGLTVPSQTTP